MLRMLLCEPQEDLSIAIREFFTAKNYVVELEPNGIKALACLQDKKYDRIVLELALHDLDGLEVIRKYRASGGITSILLLTGKISIAEQTRIFEIGADAILSQPFRLEELASKLTSMRSESTHSISNQESASESQ